MENSSMGSRLVWNIALAVCAIVWVASPAGAQPKGEQPDPARPVQFNPSLSATDFNAALRSGSFAGVNQANFGAYVTDHLLAEMTKPHMKDLLPEFREKLSKRLDASVPQGEVRDRFNDLARATIIKIINPRSNYEPVVKFNAVLLLGELDQVKGDPRNNQPPRPYSPAVSILRMIVEKEQLFSDALRVAALRGLMRHARAGIVDTGEVGKVQQAMGALFMQREPPPGRSADGHLWLRRRAADVLGELRNNGQGNSVANALVRLMGDAAEPIELRVAAARAVSRLDLSGMRATPQSFAEELAKLAVEAIESEESHEAARALIAPVAASLEGAAKLAAQPAHQAAGPKIAALQKEFKAADADLAGGDSDAAVKKLQAALTNLRGG